MNIRKKTPLLHSIQTKILIITLALTIGTTLVSLLISYYTEVPHSVASHTNLRRPMTVSQYAARSVLRNACRCTIANYLRANLLQ